MSELSNKVNKSIERLKAFEPPEGYYLAFSGGKDSCVCKALLEMAGCKYDAHYRVTSVDPPELVKFIRDQQPDVHRDIPRDGEGKPITMWNLIPRKKFPPTRAMRYCCDKLKESGGDGRLTVTGVRWAESIVRRRNRGILNSDTKELRTAPEFKPTKYGVVLMNDNDEARRMIETCYQKSKTTLNPIIDWTDAEVWEFIKAENIPICSLYGEGFHRLGCIGCPMAGKKGREREFNRWPKYKGSYFRAFKQMLDARRIKGLATDWQTPEDVFNWWMDYGVLPGQYSFDDLEELYD